MLNWTFENDNGRSPQMHHAQRYVEQWQTMRSENLGLLLWGGVGTGKSFLAGCIANALMEQEVPVRITNFARILNELNSCFSGRNEVVDKLCRYPLLIIDDFGMERGTEYALEQIYNIVDSRYRSRKPLIVTTNLTLDEIREWNMFSFFTVVSFFAIIESVGIVFILSVGVSAYKRLWEPKMYPTHNIVYRMNCFI